MNIIDVTKVGYINSTGGAVEQDSETEQINADLILGTEADPYEIGTTLINFTPESNIDAIIVTETGDEIQAAINGSVETTTTVTATVAVVTKLLVTSGTQTVTDSQDVDIVNAITEVVTTGAATGALADGAEGQHKTIICKTYAGNYVLTPTNLRTGTTITFNAAKQWVELVFENAKWKVVGGNALVTSDDGTVDSITVNGASGAIIQTTDTTLMTSTGAASGSLAAGAKNKRKLIQLIVDGGDYVLTPSSLLGGTTITFNDAGDFWLGEYVNGKWITIVNSGCTIA